MSLFAGVILEMVKFFGLLYLKSFHTKMIFFNNKYLLIFAMYIKFSFVYKVIAFQLHIVSSRVQKY